MPFLGQFFSNSSNLRAATWGRRACRTFEPLLKAHHLRHKPHCSPWGGRACAGGMPMGEAAHYHLRSEQKHRYTRPSKRRYIRDIPPRAARAPRQSTDARCAGSLPTLPASAATGALGTCSLPGRGQMNNKEKARATCSCIRTPGTWSHLVHPLSRGCQENPFRSLGLSLLSRKGGASLEPHHPPAPAAVNL